MKRVFSLLLVLSMLLFTCNFFSVGAAESTVFDYNCTTLTGETGSVPGDFTRAGTQTSGQAFFASSLNKYGLRPAAGTIIAATGANASGYVSYIYREFDITSMGFDLTATMNIRYLITPSENHVWRGFGFDVRILGGAEVWIGFNSAKQTPDANGNNVTISVMTSSTGSRSDALTASRDVNIGTLNTMKNWQFLYDGAGTLVIKLEGATLATFEGITLQSAATFPAMTTSSIYLFNDCNNMIRGTGYDTRNQVTLDNIRLDTYMSAVGNVESLALNRGYSAAEIEGAITSTAPDGTDFTVSVTPDNAPAGAPYTRTFSTAADGSGSFSLTDIPYTGFCTVKASIETSYKVQKVYLYESEAPVAPNSSLNNADGAYLYEAMATCAAHPISSPPGSSSPFSCADITYADSSTGELLQIAASADVWTTRIPVKLTGKYAVYLGYRKGSEAVTLNGKVVHFPVNTTEGDEVLEHFCFASDFADAYVTLSNLASKTASIAYLRFVRLSDARYNAYLAGENAPGTFMVDNDGYSGFFWGLYGSRAELIDGALTVYQDAARLGQMSFCSLLTTQTNYSSAVVREAINAKLTDLGLPEDNSPTAQYILRNADGSPKSYSYSRPGDNTAFTQIQNLITTEQQSPLSILAEQGADTGTEVWSNQRMAGWYSGSTYPYLNGSVYYLYQSQWAQVGSDSFRLSYYYEDFRNFMKALILEQLDDPHVTGVILDFGRYPNVLGAECPNLSDRISIMNAFIADLHDSLPAGKKLAVRICVPVATYVTPYGLDYATWVENGYIDRLITSNYTFESDYDITPFVTLCAGTQTEYYMGMVANLSGIDFQTGSTYMSTEQFLERANEGYEGGADGIFLFNDVSMTESDYVPEDYRYMNSAEAMQNWRDYVVPGTVFQNEVTAIGAAVPTPALSGVTVSVSGNGEARVQFGSAGSFVTDSSATYYPIAGETVTLTAVGDHFSYWKNTRTAAVFSTSNTLSFVATGTLYSLEAVFGDAVVDEQTRKFPVSFKDGLTGRLLQVLDIAEGDALDADDFPVPLTCFGYSFDGYRVGSSNADGYLVTRALTVVAHYAAQPAVRYNLTVSDSGRTRQYTRAFGAIATVTAQRSADFSYWQDNNGNVLSSDAVYPFGMPAHDVTLTAVYAQSIPDAVAALTSAFVDEDGNLILMLSRSVSTGSIAESGVLITRRATPADLTVDTAVSSVTRGITTAPKSASVVAFRKSGMFTKPGTWYFRGYVTYLDEVGALHTVYSAVYTAVISDSAVTATKL